MLIGFLPIFVVDTNLIYGYDFVAPLIKDTLMQISKYLYMFLCVDIKTIPWKFHILDPKNSGITCS